MIIVSDTTPIISLIKINRMDLLKKLFGTIIIPQAVFFELTTNDTFQDEARIVKFAPFIKPMPIRNSNSLDILQAISGLDYGESEAIILANELKADVLIIDERKGRNVAQKLGIKITGTIGVLLYAYNKNIITAYEVQLYLEQLKDSNIRLSESLINNALAMLHI